MQWDKIQIVNTPYMTNSTLVYPVKMEYVSKINIFGKSDDEKWSRKKYSCMS